MKTLESQTDYCDVWLSTDDGAIVMQDETGETIYLDKKQASEFLPLLKYFIDTGEMPE